MCAPLAVAADEPRVSDQSRMDQVRAETPPAEDNLRDEEAGPRTGPRSTGVILEGTVGVALPFGAFKQYAQSSPWLHLDLGVEPIRSLAILAQGDLYFFEGRGDADATRTRGIPVFSFGAAVRFTLRPTDRVGVYFQGQAGFSKADVAVNSLAVVGFREAESLSFYFGGAIGAEWYQMDRHLALGLVVDVRNMLGFRTTVGGVASGAAPWGSSGLTLRYAF